MKREGKGRVVVGFHGDGATEEGGYWESLNFAALHKLPILFICENNGLAIHEPLSKRWATMDLRAKVAAFGVPATVIEDGDVFRIRDATAEAVASMRAGNGPVFIECKTYRWREHVGPGDDHSAGYRSTAEFERWRNSDEVVRLAAIVDDATRHQIDARIEKQIQNAVRFAEASPFPTEEELMAHVYAE